MVIKKHVAMKKKSISFHLINRKLKLFKRKYINKNINTRGRVKISAGSRGRPLEKTYIKRSLILFDCMFLSSHVRVSE